MDGQRYLRISNSAFYEKVFELILRLRGNYLWPAMWGSAFYDDDPRNGVLANEMGIIMGTSHHEPMAMVQTDWHRYVQRNNSSPISGTTTKTPMHCNNRGDMASNEVATGRRW